MTAPRTVLLLQGPPTPFWRELGAAIDAAGHRCLKITFTLGGMLFWRRGGETLYRGRIEEWAGWLDAYCREHGVTDIMYFADRLPYHIGAAEVGERMGIRVWAIENGYLRPDWLTLEPFGMGRASRFPKDPAVIRQWAEGEETPSAKVLYRHGFVQEAVCDITFNLAMLAGRPFFWNFADDRYYPIIADYLCWVPKTIRQWRTAKLMAEVEAACAGGLDFTLLAMQLQSDYQIRASSSYTHLTEMLEEVIGSMATHAGTARHLVLKFHPLESGWENWPKHIERIAAKHGLSDRVHWLDGGDLGLLLRDAASVITVNSTVGMHAIRRGKPTLALGTAIYDVPGLTHQGGLDSFWQSPEPIDQDLMEALVTALAARIQVRGSFYDPEGRKAAVTEVVRRLGEGERYWFS